MRDLEQRRFPARDGRSLTVLKANLLVLLGLLALTFFLPLSGSEHWFLTIAMAVLAGINWSLLEYAGRG